MTRRQRLLVISGCTREKAADDPERLTLDDFRDPERFDTRQSQLWHLALPASQLYRGEEHLRTVEAVTAIREEHGPRSVAHLIVSAGYGLLEAQQPIVPYDATFDGMNDQELEAWSKQLDLPDAVRGRTLKADAVALVLPWSYRRAVGELPAEPGQRLIRLDPIGEIGRHIADLLVPRRRSFASVAEDARFLRDFESSVIPMPQWTHRAHLRMAWLMAAQGEPRDVVPRVKRALGGLLAKYGIAQSSPHGYHETVTLAWLMLLAELRKRAKHPCADAFLDEHPQLLDKHYLLTFYSRSRIMSGDARQGWVEPDLRPLPGP